MFSPFSEANSRVQPGRKVASSHAVGWTSLLLEVWEQPSTVEEFETVSSPDQTLVLTSAGEYNIECYSRGAWRSAQYRPGLGGMTAPMNTGRLRWRSSLSSQVTTIHLYIPPAHFIEVGEEYRRAGTRLDRSPLDALSISDPSTYAMACALASAVRTGAPNLYADATCRMLATHMLFLGGRLRFDDLSRGIGAELTDRRLARVLEFLRHRFAADVNLDQLAREAGISRFHFTRLFKRKLGMTPYQYLINLRMKHASLLLRTTDLDILAVAHACGYSHAGRFAAAFRQHFSITPNAYRNHR